MVVDISGSGLGLVMVAGLRCQDRVFEFEFVWACGLITLSIIVDERSWVSLELLDQQGGAWVLYFIGIFLYFI